MGPGEARNSTSVSLLEDKEATENIINHVELSRSQYRIGVSQVLLRIVLKFRVLVYLIRSRADLGVLFSNFCLCVSARYFLLMFFHNFQVFFRSGILNIMEDKRNEKVSSVMIAFQAQCRGYLARKRSERKKVSFFDFLIFFAFVKIIAVPFNDCRSGNVSSCPWQRRFFRLKNKHPAYSCGFSTSQSAISFYALESASFIRFGEKNISLFLGSSCCCPVYSAKYSEVYGHPAVALVATSYESAPSCGSYAHGGRIA